jgi:hydroxymethylbilane synthase
MQTKLVIGSRGSDLALYQANFIRGILEKEFDCSVEIKIIKTAGDKLTQLSFDKMEGKGFFTKELEDALLCREIDLAVHSLKDLMTTQPDGLKLGAAGYRADRREMLLIRKESRQGDGLLPVKKGGIIGTSSVRRKCQIAYHDPSLITKDLRGNVPTRVAKLREGQFDAILIAAAGVTRLNLDTSDLDSVLLDPEDFLPAPAQGILGIQIRSDDPRVDEVVSRMGSEDAATEAFMERGLLARYDAGCSLPLGVFSEISPDGFRLKAILGVQKDEEWIDFKRADITGSDKTEAIDSVFNILSIDEETGERKTTEIPPGYAE